MDETIFITSNFKEILIGMAHNCPILFTGFLKKEDLRNDSQFFVKGGIVKITKEQFTTITVKNDVGITQDFLVLADFKGSDLLTENKIKKADSILLEYGEIKLYNAKVNNFTVFKVIKFLEKK